MKKASWENHAQQVCEQLNEKQRRWVAGLLSEVLGWGGTKQVASATGLDSKTIRQGRIDLENELSNYPKERVRRAGGGRPTLKKKSRELSKHYWTWSSWKREAILKDTANIHGVAYVH